MTTAPPDLVRRRALRAWATRELAARDAETALAAAEATA